MIKKISRYLIVTITVLISFFLISVTASKIIFENQFSLKTKDLRGYEELTSKVFKLTTHNNHQKMSHHFLIQGANFLPNTWLDNILTEDFFFVYQTAMNYFKLDGYLCGGHSQYLQRIFWKNNIKSIAYDHGSKDTEFTHVLVIAEYDDDLYIFDPTFNYVYKDDEKYLTFKNIIDLISEKKDIERFIKIIDPEDKVFNMEKKLYESYSVSSIKGRINQIGSQIDDKSHILLNGFGMYAGSDKDLEYFFKKYPYLKDLIL
tara:strand:- start:70 stop:849 length:780 start_codon:yes stop_codon:yes gene_type:complete